MRYLSFLLIGVFIFFGFACRNNILNSSTEVTNTAPPVMNQNGVSLQATSVVSGNEIVKLGLKAVNGSEDKVLLSERYDALILRDNLGNEYQTKGEELELLPLTTNDLEIEFLAKIPSDAKTLSLTINSKNSNSTREPRFVLENIPVPGGGRIVFAPVQNPPNLTFDDKSVNHPNGTSFTVQQINFGENTIDVSFQTVNGSNFGNDFATRNTSAFLKDDKSNRYFLIPSASGSEIKMAAREKMSGTLRFAGKIAPDAAKLSLHLNDSTGSDSDQARSPKIIVSDIQIKK